MKWDCGALSANPRQSPIFRELTIRQRHYFSWPEAYQQEATAFVSTPGVSVNWVLKNLHMEPRTARKLRARWPEWAQKGYENMLTATYDDARRYMERSDVGFHIPPWVVPFALADKKSGMSTSEFLKTWGDIRRNFMEI